MGETDKKAITYISYLKVDELLELQQPESDGEHDEMLFIIIHQTYELWFKQMLHEVAELQKVLARGETHRALAILGRVRTIMKTCVGQLDILETMTPLQFNSFRARLSSASGFQSAQFRELEAFAAFGSDLDAASKSQLERGSRLVQLLIQGQYAPLPMEKAVASLWAGTTGNLDDVPVDDIGRFEVEFHNYLDREHASTLAAIRDTRDLSDDNIEDIKKGINNFKKQFVKANEKTDLNAVKAFLENNGFINKKNHDYFNESLGLILEDLHDENVLTQNGMLYFIDTVFYIVKHK